MKPSFRKCHSEKCCSQGISIRWKLAAYMSGFVLLILLLIWFFQIFLLDSFFFSVKKKEMKNAAAQLGNALETDSLTSQTYEEAVDHSLGIMIYEFRDKSILEIVNTDVTGNNVITTLSEEGLVRVYRKAQSHGGSCFFTNFSFGGSETDKDRHQKPTRLVYAELKQVSEQKTYLILLDTSMQPLDSTVQILKTQHGWVTLLILMGAGFMVFLLYRHISKPLIRMTESAKLLAKGKYDVDFSGSGYRETRELADTLNYASRELSRLDSLQKELIANISHDLRTPLTMIRGYGEMMRDIPGENTPENMQAIIDETSRLSELVNDLLDLSRLQAGTAAPDPTLFNLTNAVREVLLRYDQLVKHNGYRVSFDYDKEVTVCADRGMLLQVLYNLINNAINYTGEDRTVKVTQTTLGASVRITVTDTGKGIAPEEMPLIWDRYYKVDKVHRRATVGTGLGLSIVKTILEQHNATYGVNSTVGEGSSFWFELPIADPYINYQLED